MNTEVMLLRKLLKEVVIIKTELMNIRNEIKKKL